MCPLAGPDTLPLSRSWVPKTMLDMLFETRVLNDEASGLVNKAGEIPSPLSDSGGWLQLHLAQGRADLMVSGGFRLRIVTSTPW